MLPETPGCRKYTLLLCEECAMKKYSMEFAVGCFVFITLVCVGYLTIRLGKMDIFTDKGYTVIANFSSITGLRAGAEVEISGVSVGKVAKIELDPKRYKAKVLIRLNEGIELPDDSGASIKTSGLIGDKYISLSPGGSTILLQPGEEIGDTNDAVDIEGLISKYVFGSVK